MTNGMQLYTPTQGGVCYKEVKDLIMAHGQHSTGPIRPACFLATNGNYVRQYHVVISPWQQGQRCLFRSLFLRGFSSNCEVPSYSN